MHVIIDELFFFFEFSFFTAGQSIHLQEVGRATVTHPTGTPVPFYFYMQNINSEMCVNWSTREIWKFNCVCISLNNFRRVFGQSTVPFDVSACCSNLWGSWVDRFFFCYNMPAQLLYVVRGRLFYSWKKKRKKTRSYEYYIYRHQTKRKQFIFILVVGVCIIEIYLVRPKKPVEILFFFFLFFFSLYPWASILIEIR